MPAPENPLSPTLRQLAIDIIRTPQPAHKVQLARDAAAKWRLGRLLPAHSSENLTYPDLPGRPQQPELLPPARMPRRRIGSRRGLIALVHSLTHIELNAIDMTWDLIARFAESDLPPAFLDEAVTVGLDEANHFELINNHLEKLGASYGDLPAHGGFWDAAQNTAHDLLARLAIVPLVLEARGLDVSPGMIRQVEASGAIDIASSMMIIYNDEITHVAFGARWFKFLCDKRRLAPEPTYQNLVRQYFHGSLKPPFNEEARNAAGFEATFYAPLAAHHHG